MSRCACANIHNEQSRAHAGGLFLVDHPVIGHVGHLFLVHYTTYAVL